MASPLDHFQMTIKQGMSPTEVHFVVDGKVVGKIVNIGPGEAASKCCPDSNHPHQFTAGFCGVCGEPDPQHMAAKDNPPSLGSWVEAREYYAVCARAKSTEALLAEAKAEMETLRASSVELLRHKEERIASLQAEVERVRGEFGHLSKITFAPLFESQRIAEATLAERERIVSWIFERGGISDFDRAVELLAALTPPPTV